MALCLFLAAMLVAGRQAARRIWAHDWAREQPSAGPFERASATALFTLAVAIALSWALALPKLLTRESLLVGAAVLFGGGVAAWWISRSKPSDSTPGADGVSAQSAPGRLDASSLVRIAMIVSASVLTLAGAFFLWRSAVVFQPSHDATAYHLPKAALLVRAHGFEVFDGTDARITSWPCDYELLLADVLLLDGGDAHTAWLSVALWAFFLLSVAGIAERWWGRGPHVMVAVLVTAAMPVVLLHADTHKNDVLTAALFLTSIASGARWAAGGGRAPLLTAFIGVAIALGTKVSAPFLVAAMGMLGVWGVARRWRARARPSPREIVAWCACAAVLFLALGGSAYMYNAFETGRLLGAPAGSWRYGDWKNIFRFTYLALARPFSASAENVWVPWRHAYWHWARHDLYFSEWGRPTSLLFALLPFGIVRYARREPSGSPRATERVVASLGALVLFLLFLPIRLEPFGFFATFVRYTIFFPVLISLWTVTPAVAELSARGGASRILAAASVLAGVTVFVHYLGNEALYDEREPLDYVVDVARHPETRRARRSWGEDRACVVVDLLAGPEDTIALDSGALDSWPYYCFGTALRRGVVFLHPERGLPVVIPDAAKWVAVDHIGSIAFGHPGFHDLGDWDKYILKGKSSAEDLAVFNQMKADPRFRLVRRNEATNQAIFERIARP